jgi:hypothetical protein
MIKSVCIQVLVVAALMLAGALLALGCRSNASSAARTEGKAGAAMREREEGEEDEAAEAAEEEENEAAEQGEEDEATEGGGEESLPVSQLPEAVRHAAAQYFNHLDGCVASKEMDEGAVVYEVVGKGSDGLEVSLLCSANGAVAEVERELPIQSLSEETRADLARRFPGAKVDKVEAIEKHYTEVHFWVGSKQGEVLIESSGRVVGGEESEEHERD